ncbi:MAG: glucose-1-phosphate cytidylyltransferase, partial [Thaumarchaeota archaeon]|nr:glucose-1-phosphate cytidylyltransferase [Nitrososphaerota archaeon]
MKTVILAGGRGTRIGEVTYNIPKPLIEIGEMPVIWHIMKIYSSHGINDFVICCGYKGNMIKEYFANYFLNMADVTINVKQNKMEIHDKHVESWNVTLVDTGLETMTGGRLKRIKKYVEDDTFCLTYGDDLKNVNITGLIQFHRERKRLATITVARNPDRFGVVNIDGDKVTSLKEKPLENDTWINGGYFVLEPKVLDYIHDDSTFFEHEPLNNLIKEGQLSAYKYDGLYQPLDTLRDKQRLEDLWNS